MNKIKKKMIILNVSSHPKLKKPNCFYFFMTECWYFWIHHSYGCLELGPFASTSKTFWQPASERLNIIFPITKTDYFCTWLVLSTTAVDICKE